MPEIERVVSRAAHRAIWRTIVFSVSFSKNDFSWRGVRVRLARSCSRASRSASLAAAASALARSGAAGLARPPPAPVRQLVGQRA